MRKTLKPTIKTMMKKIFCSAFAAAAVLTACKDGETATPATGFDVKDNATQFEISQNSSIDLRTLFTANGAGATFAFTILNQPVSTSIREFEGAGHEWVVYSIDADGHTLKCADVRVPDVLTSETFDNDPRPDGVDPQGNPTNYAPTFYPDSHLYTRDVLNGELRVVCTLQDGTKLPAKTFPLVQINKSDLEAPRIKFAQTNGVDNLTEAGAIADSKSIEMQQSSTAQSVAVAGQFEVEPIDYAYGNSRVLVFIGEDPAATVLEENTTGTIMLKANAAAGMTDYIVAVYNTGEPAGMAKYGANGSYVPTAVDEVPTTPAENGLAYRERVKAKDFAAADASKKGRIYINVQAPPTVTGIVIHPDVGVKNASSFYRTTYYARTPANYVQVKLSDGTYEAVGGDISGPLGFGDKLVIGDIGGLDGATGATAASNICGYTVSSMDACGDAATLESTYAIAKKSNGDPVSIHGRSWFKRVSCVGNASTYPASKPAPSVGDRVKFVVTHLDHFMEAGYTVTIDEPFLAVAPEA